MARVLERSCARSMRWPMTARCGTPPRRCGAMVVPPCQVVHCSLSSTTFKGSSEGKSTPSASPPNWPCRGRMQEMCSSRRAMTGATHPARCSSTWSPGEHLHSQSVGRPAPYQHAQAAEHQRFGLSTSVIRKALCRRICNEMQVGLDASADQINCGQSSAQSLVGSSWAWSRGSAAPCQPGEYIHVDAQQPN